MNGDPTKPQSRVSPFWKWLAVFGVIASLALVGLRMFGAHIMPPEIPKTIAEWEKTHVELPASWHQPAELPSEESVEFHRELSAEVAGLHHKYDEFLFGADNRSGLVGGYSDPTVLEDQRSTFSNIMSELQPLIERASQVVKSPGYIFDTDPLLAYEAVSSHNVSMFAKLLLVHAKEHALAGECNSAFESAALALRLLKRPEQANKEFHFQSATQIRFAATTIYAICEQCADADSLKSALKILNDLRDTVLTSAENIYYSELLSPLRYAAAYGYPVDLSPKSHAEFQRQKILLTRGDYYRWVIDNMPAGSEQVRSARANLNHRDEHEMHGFSVKELGWRFFLNPTVLKLAVGYDLEMITAADRSRNNSYYRKKVAIATSLYDLARIELARKVAELNDDGTTISDYLSPVPNDPFTSAPFRYSKKIDRYYSVGQDGIDHHATKKFDYYYPDGPGDIWLGATIGK